VGLEPSLSAHDGHVALFSNVSCYKRKRTMRITSQVFVLLGGSVLASGCGAKDELVAEPPTAYETPSAAPNTTPQVEPQTVAVEPQDYSGEMSEKARMALIREAMAPMFAAKNRLDALKGTWDAPSIEAILAGLEDQRDGSMPIYALAVVERYPDKCPKKVRDMVKAVEPVGSWTEGIKTAVATVKARALEALQATSTDERTSTPESRAKTGTAATDTRPKQDEPAADADAEMSKFRTWTSTAKTTLEAEFVTLVQNNRVARLDDRNGKKHFVPLDQLIEADREWIRKHTK
jgi:hypothetical protein